MSDRGLAKELKARNVLAERIAAVLRQRQEIGAERRAHEREYQRLNNDRALARHYRLSGVGVAQQVDGVTGHPESGPRAARDVHANKVMKSHTPECCKIEQFSATFAPMKTYHLCTQDFKTKDYTLEFYGRAIAITHQQFDDGTWYDIVRRAFQ